MSGPANIHLEIEALEELAKEDASAPLPVHLASCAECAAELAWLRRERRLFADRAELSPSASEDLWSGVAARIAEEKPAIVAVQTSSPISIRRARPHLWRRRVSLLAVALPAAAVLVIAIHPISRDLLSDATVLDSNSISSTPEDEIDPGPELQLQKALDEAEQDTANAVQVLEAEAQALRPRLRAEAGRGFDRSLQSARERLDAARLASANDFPGAREDVQSRVRMLNGYTRYLRSLQEMVKDIEETRP